MGSELEQLEHIRAELLRTIGGLDDAALDRKGVVGEWSVKNVLAHLAAWEDWVAKALPARLATGETPADMRARTEDEDRYNALEIGEREKLSPDEQLAELARIRAGLVGYVGSLDEATMRMEQPWIGWDGTIGAYLLEALGQHEQEHIDELRAAL